MVEHPEDEGEIELIGRQDELTVEVDRVDLDGRVERGLQRLEAAHGVVIDGGVVDDLHLTAERFEEEGEISVRAADVDDDAITCKIQKATAVAGQQLIEVLEVGERVV